MKRRNWSELEPVAYAAPTDLNSRLIALLDDVEENDDSESWSASAERQLYRLVNFALAHGWGEDEIVTLFMVWGDTEPPPLVAYLRAHRTDQLELYLRNLVQQCQNYQSKRSAQADAEAWYAATHWPDWRQGAALRVYLAGLQLTASAGGRSFTKSDRDFSRHAGIGTVDHSDTKTFRSARKYLQEQGALRVRSTDQSNPLLASTRYSVARPGEWLAVKGTNSPTTNLLNVDAISGVLCSPTLAELLHPVWDRAGAALGIQAAVIWYLLRTEGPMSAPEIAKSLGMSTRGVRNVLGRLQGVELVCSDSGTWEGVDADLDAVADALGVADHPERRALAHERQRLGYMRYRLENPEKALRIDMRRLNASGAWPGPLPDGRLRRSVRP